jgi:D-glycero-D-manno-heptose 1,7-bisphosphate phosphatase
MPQPTARLHIFDADGTLRWTTVPGQPCPNRPGEWRLMPNVKETLRNMHWGPGGSLLGVASNQGGVALGYLTQEMAYQLIEATLVEAIGFIPPRTMIEMCVCPPDAQCACRKPNPGMLLRIMRALEVGPEATLYIGDLEIDQEAAKRAGVAFMWAHEFFQWPSG